jgi:hypothetical protein
MIMKEKLNIEIPGRFLVSIVATKKNEKVWEVRIRRLIKSDVADHTLGSK